MYFLWIFLAQLGCGCCVACSSSWCKASACHCNSNSRGCKDDYLRTKDTAKGWSILVQETRISPLVDTLRSLSGTYILAVICKQLRDEHSLFILQFCNCAECFWVGFFLLVLGMISVHFMFTNELHKSGDRPSVHFNRSYNNTSVYFAAVAIRLWFMLYQKPPFGVLPPYTGVWISEHHLISSHLNHEFEDTFHCFYSHIYLW